MNAKLLSNAVGLALAATLGSANADPLSWYIGGDLVQVETKVTDQTGIPPIVTGSAKATSLRIKGGMHILPWLDAELQGIVPNEETYSTVGTTNKVETAVVALFAKPNTNLGPVNVYALLGIAGTGVRFTGVLEGDKSFSDIAYGLGAQYKINRHFAVSADWTRYGKKNLGISGLPGGIDVEVNAFGVGVNYTF